jgi:type IV secretion system protein VirD4
MIVLRWLFFFLKVLWVVLVYAAKGLSLIVRVINPDFRAQGAYGTARWATSWEKIRGGVYGGTGPVIGKGSFGRIMRFNRDGIVHVFARTGAGKGLGIVIPTLLDYPGSIVVTDIKGENYALTAKYRSTLGPVFKIDPFDISRSARFNPLDMIRKGTDQESDDARALATLMVIPDSRESHWSDKSISLVSAFILDALHQPDEVNRTLAYVRKRSTGGGGRNLEERIRDIAETSPSPLAQTIALGILDTMGGDDQRMPEFASVLSDMQKATEVWTEGTPAGRLSARSTFHFEQLNNPDLVTTIYICLDEEKLESYRRWLRVMTGCTLNAIMRSKRTSRPRHKVVLLLDEARALGRLDPLVNTMGFLRAYCTPVLIWQNKPQVSAIYGEQADEFLANASCRVFFGIDNEATAQEVSRMCGQKGILSRSQNVSQSSDAWLRENRSLGESEGGYWLIDPSEVMRLPDTTAIVKMRPVPYPMLTTRMDYRRHLRWTGRFGAWGPGVAAPVPAQEPAPPPVPPRAPYPAPSRAQASEPAASPPPGAPPKPPRADAARW